MTILVSKPLFKHPTKVNGTERKFFDYLGDDYRVDLKAGYLYRPKAALNH